MRFVTSNKSLLVKVNPHAALKFSKRNHQNVFCLRALYSPVVWIQFDVDPTSSVKENSESWSHHQVEERRGLLDQQVVLQVVAAVNVFRLTIHNNL